MPAQLVGRPNDKTMSKIRTFIAVEVNDTVRRRAADLIERLRVSGADVKWVDPTHMHLTLKFLGDVRDTEVPAICNAVSQAAAQVEPFDAAFGGAGAFPDAQRPRTLWMGVSRNTEALVQLHDVIDEALRPLGFAVERRRFHPHLTLGRLRKNDLAVGRLSDLVEEHGTFDGSASDVSEALIFASFLERGGPRYEVMGRAALG